MTPSHPDLHVTVAVGADAEVSARLRAALEELADALADEALPPATAADPATGPVTLGPNRRLDPFHFEVCVGFVADVE